MMPIRVVSAIEVADGHGTYLTSHHRYADLRASAYGDGPLGFKMTIITDPLGIETTTTYAQGYPYTGMPIKVQKHSWDEADQGYTDPVTETNTQLCDAIPTDPDNCIGNGGRKRIARRSSFPYPRVVTDTAYLRTSTFPEFLPAKWVTTTTQFDYDDVGNATGTTVDMQSSDGTEATRSDTVSYYGSLTSTEHKLGKVLSTMVTNQQITPADPNNPERRHITNFEYLPISTAGGLKLSKKKVEPDSPVAGAEQHTVYTYDEFGNVVSTSIDGTIFSTQFDYDNFGRQSVVRYPAIGGTRLALRNNYSAVGSVRYVDEDATDNSVYWLAEEMDASGRVTREITRNGVETVSTRNGGIGWLRDSQSTALADGETLIQHRRYNFDEVGNLRGRSRNDALNPADTTETFTYDPLDRLVTAQVSTTQGYTSTSNYSYDLGGNFTTKDDQVYTFSGCMAGTRPAGPHAVCNVGTGPMFAYDGNGNATDLGTWCRCWTTRLRTCSSVACLEIWTHSMVHMSCVQHEGAQA